MSLVCLLNNNKIVSVSLSYILDISRFMLKGSIFPQVTLVQITTTFLPILLSMLNHCNIIRSMAILKNKKQKINRLSVTLYLITF